MQQIKLSLPAMYADHHVLRVREVLGAIDGVSDIVASSAVKTVRVQCDDSVSEKEIEKALTDAGSSSNQELPLGPVVLDDVDESAWYKVMKRVTATDREDLEMSGDFRRY